MNYNFRKISILLIVVGSLVSMGSVCPKELWGADLYVSEDGQNGAYVTIQEAIDAAVTGDTVIIQPDEYTGEGNRDLDFQGKAITVRSAHPDDPNFVIIDCQGSEEEPYRGFLFESGEDLDSVLEGVTIKNGYDNSGGGIFCSGSHPTIRNCVISNNITFGNGGGIFCQEQSQPLITGCRIENNQALDFDGGGIACIDSSPIIRDCIIADNEAERFGGGIFSESESVVTIEACVLRGNTAIFGGGIYCDGRESDFLNSIISGNLASSSGGGGYCSDGEILFTNCTLVGNWAGVVGGGIKTIKLETEGVATLINSIVWDNRVGPEGDGEQIAVGDDNQPNLTSCDIQGGVVYEDPGDLVSIVSGTTIDTDPLFVQDGSWQDPETGIWLEGNYQLAEDSPCRNVGDDDAVDGIEADISGNDRLLGSGVDIGAYEMAVPDGPDLRGEFLLVQLEEIMVPGDKGKVQIQVYNDGNESAVGTIEVAVYLSTDQRLQEGDILLGRARGKVKLTGDKYKNFKVKVTIPADILPGDYYVLAKIDAGDGPGAILEADESFKSNEVVESQAWPLVWKFGSFTDTRKPVQLKVNDPNNVPVTFKLKGEGWGEIQGAPNFNQVRLYDTTEKSALTISTKGKGLATKVGDFLVEDGASLRSISAKTTDLHGDILVEGTVEQITLRDVRGTTGEQIIEILGEPLSNKAGLNLKLGRVRDLNLLSDFLPIKSITAQEWLNGDDVFEFIAAPSLKKLTISGDKKNPQVAGDFQADLNLGYDPNDLVSQVLGTVKIAGAIDFVFWDIWGNVGSITAGSVRDSFIWIGCDVNLEELTGQASDFFADYTLKSLTLKGMEGETWSNSEMAAWDIVKVKFPKEATASGLFQYWFAPTVSNEPAGEIEWVEVPDP